MTGWLDYDNSTYYMNDEGETASGITIIDDVPYFFGIKYKKLMVGPRLIEYNGDLFCTDKKGVLQTGMQKVDGKYYYFDKTTYKAVSGWQEIDGEKYYFDDNKKFALSDVNEIDGKKYFFGIKYKKLMKGWITYNNITYYADLNTGVLYSDFNVIDGKKYFFGLKYNKLYKGWLLYPYDNKTYYLDKSTGEFVANMFKEVDGYMYYFDENGNYITGNRRIDGIDYYFYDNGHLKDNFVNIGGKMYYYYSNGTKAIDWVNIAGTKYFFNSLGVMVGKNVKKVIDVSEHQGVIDWEKVKNSGEVDAVILRISAGSAYEDKQLARNVSELNRLNIPYGVYIYSYAEDMISNVSDLGMMHEGSLEALRVIKSIKKYNIKLSLPIYYDLEVWENGRNRLWNSSNYTRIVQQFESKLSEYGYNNWQIYSNKNWAESVLNTAYLKNRVSWVAQYNHYCTYNGNYNIWQYSSSEYIPGISKRVDVNVWF